MHAKLAAVLALGLCVATAATAQAGPPSYTGTYETGAAKGTIKWTPTRGVQPGYYLGNLVVNGKGHTGYVYYLRDGTNRVTLGYNDSNGNMMCSMLLTPQADGTLVGPITFYRPNGTVSATGTATLR